MAKDWSEEVEVYDEDEEPGGLWKEKFDKQDLLKVLIMTVGKVSQDAIAYELGISRRSLNRYFKHEMEIARETIKGHVAGAIYKNAMKGNIGAQKLLAAQLLGWKEEATVEHKHYVPVLEIKPPEGIDHSKPMFNHDDIIDYTEPTGSE